MLALSIRATAFQADSALPKQLPSSSAPLFDGCLSARAEAEALWEGIHIAPGLPLLEREILHPGGAAAWRSCRSGVKCSWATLPRAAGASPLLRGPTLYAPVRTPYIIPSTLGSQVDSPGQ
jgi:hypothetical protein